MKKLLFSIIISVLYFSPTISEAQSVSEGEDVSIGKSYTLKSEIMGEDRPFLVHLPRNYDASGNPVPVMYVLDGDFHFHHTTGVAMFLAAQRRMPEMIVVSIPNTTDRTRDLTPEISKDMKAKKNFPTGGGADKMLSFIKKELIPHINATYNTSSYKMLIGHSFGGIFVVNSLLKEPDLFDSYISISPSMWWDDQSLVDKATTFFADKPELDVFFYMTMGNEGGTMLGGAMKLAALFEEYNSENFHWDFKVLKEETHGSVPHRSTYNGLEAIFKDWYSADVADIYQSDGIKGVEKHYARISDKLGYEWKVDEVSMNNLGYQILGKGQIANAIEVFEKNVKDFPSSYNVYDSMGEAYMANKENDKAISHFKKSLALHPGNANSVKMLKELGVNYDPMATKLDLSAKKLSAYVGKYQTPMGILDVVVEDGKLMGEVADKMEKGELIPFPEQVFLFKRDNIVLHFEVDDNKKIKGFTAHMGIGNTLKGIKTPTTR